MKGSLRKLRASSIYSRKGKIEIDDDNDLKRFHRALYQKKSTLTDVTATEGGPIVGKLLDFTVPFPLFRDVMRREETKTFVRNDDEKLWKKIKNDYHKRFLIVGKPGIGKSRFLLYVLRQLIHEGIANNILITGRYARAVLITKDGIDFRESGDINQVLDDPKSWWLMDGKEQGPYPNSVCRIILVASDEPKYHLFIKQAIIYWMPEWDQADQGKREEDKKYIEIRSLRKHLYPSVSEEDMMKAAYYWGPVPLRVFSNFCSRRQSDESRYNLYELHNQIGGSSHHDMADMVSSIRSRSWTCWAIQDVLSFSIGKSFMCRTSASFSSNYIADKYWELIFKEQRYGDFNDRLRKIGAGNLLKILPSRHPARRSKAGLRDCADNNTSS